MPPDSRAAKKNAGHRILLSRVSTRIRRRRAVPSAAHDGPARPRDRMGICSLSRPQTIGAYVSVNTRNGTWGTGAIAAISERLSRELPGLRGFSPSNMKNMRQFSEGWAVPSNRQLTTDDLMKSLSDETVPAIRQLATGDLKKNLKDDSLPAIRQLSTGELSMAANGFLSIANVCLLLVTIRI